jgi:hypothetical protein
VGLVLAGMVTNQIWLALDTAFVAVLFALAVRQIIFRPRVQFPFSTKLDLSLSETQSGWQVKPNCAMFLSYERSLQLGLVGAGLVVPVAGLVES